VNNHAFERNAALPLTRRNAARKPRAFTAHSAAHYTRSTAPFPASFARVPAAGDAPAFESFHLVPRPVPAKPRTIRLASSHPAALFIRESLTLATLAGTLWFQYEIIRCFW